MQYFDEDRLIDLETKFSHQEFIIEQLKLALEEQNKELIVLKKTIAVLRDQIHVVAPEKLQGSPVNEKPPHY